MLPENLFLLNNHALWLKIIVFLNFFPALLSISTFFGIQGIIEAKNQYPIEHIFEIFPPKDFKKAQEKWQCINLIELLE
jgi:hypothetical protein